MPGLFVTLRCRGLALVVLAIAVAACGRPDDRVLGNRPVLEAAAAYDGSRQVAVPFTGVAGRRYVARLEQIDGDAELALLDGTTVLARTAGPARGLGDEYLSFTVPADRELTFEIRTASTPARSAAYALRVHELPEDLPADVATAFGRWMQAVTAVEPTPDPGTALANLRAAESVWDARDPTLAAAVRLQIAALEYWQQDDWSAAVDAAERAAADHARAGDEIPRADATVLAALARIELARERRGTNPAAATAAFTAARRQLGAARAAYAANSRPVAAAMTEVYEGSALYYDYDLAGAVRHFATAERALATAGAEDERRVVLGNLAVASADRGDYRTAARVYDELLPLLAARRDEMLAATLLNGASTRLALGEAERALGLYVEALGVAAERDLPRIRIHARIGLGSAHLQLGQSELAAAHLEAALGELGDGDRHTRVIALLRLGEAWRQLGRTARADAAHDEAAAIAATLGSPTLRARIAVTRAHGYATAGRLARAVATYDEALALPLPESHAVVARALVGRGRAQRLLGRTDAARADLVRAAALSEANGSRETAIAAALEQAELARRAGDGDAALALAERAADGARALSAEMVNADNRVTAAARLRAAQDLVVELLAADARRHAAAGDRRAAEARAMAALLAADAALPGAPPAAGAATAEQQRVASMLAERRYRLESLADRHAAPTPTMQAIAREIADLQSQLARLGDAGAAPTSGAAAPLHAARLQQRVPAGALLLVYSLGTERSWRWTIGRDRFDLEPLPHAAAVDRQVEALLGAVQALHAPARAEAAARALAADVLPRDLDGATRLLVVPDGSLGAVPWALLAGARPALQLASYAAVLAPEAPAWTGAGLRLALFGDPIFAADDPRLPPRAVAASAAVDAFAPAQLPRLPGTARELAAIAALAPVGAARIATGATATRDAVAALPPDGTDVLHLATHATLDTRVPALASIVLSRRDASGRELAGDLRPHDILALAARPRLVVLSACDAAAEPSRAAAGLMNLTRAFLGSGARYVVASRWAVGDASAVALMTEFYRALLQDGLPPDAALARAQQSLAGTAAWRAPFHWAGFVVTAAAP